MLCVQALLADAPQQYDATYLYHMSRSVSVHARVCMQPLHRMPYKCACALMLRVLCYIQYCNQIVLGAQAIMF
jgi:hypothetical protein